MATWLVLSSRESSSSTAVAPTSPKSPKPYGRSTFSSVLSSWRRVAPYLTVGPTENVRGPTTGFIQADHLVLHGGDGGRPPADSPTDLNTMERETILQVLRETRWNKSKAAIQLGLSRMQLYGRMRKYSLDGAATA